MDSSFSILVDEALDCSKQEQLPFVFKIFWQSLWDKRRIYRTLLLWFAFAWESFISSSSYWDWKSYFRYTNCGGQGYEGTASISSHINCLSAHIHGINEKTVYTYFYSHQLNLVVAASCNIPCTYNPATLEAESWNVMGSVPAEGNKPSIGRRIVWVTVIQHRESNPTKHLKLL